MTIAVTYTFSNGTTSSATEVNTNFQDIIDGVTDGTEPISVGQLTVAGATALNGNTTIGNASSDDLTITASLASSIAIKTANTYGIGGAGVGLTGIYYQSSASHTTRLVFGSGVANITWTMPGTVGTAGYGLQSNGSGTFSYQPMQTDINAVSSADYTVLDTDGYKNILVTTGASDRTITLPTAADNTDRVLVIKKVDSGAGTVIVDGESSETIDGDTTITLRTQYEYIRIVCDGSNWHILNTDALGLTNAAATRLGLKSYLHGTTYNGSVAPTVTSTATLSSVIRAVFVPYQMQDGSWRMKFNMALAYSAGAAGFTITINGVLFKNVSNYRQAITSSRETAAGDGIQGQNTVPNTATLYYENVTNMANDLLLSGDVELESKPTWAY